MKTKTQLRIEARAHDLLEQHNCLRRPVPLEVLAHRLGLRVQPALLGDEVSGVLVVQGEQGTIGYNTAHPPVRQRFTIAHEIGHFVLHQKDSKLFIDKAYTSYQRNQHSSSGEDRREVDANQFAAALLMPEDLLREEVDRVGFDLGDEDDLRDLARAFDVSQQSMSYRLANLGII